MMQIDRTIPAITIAAGLAFLLGLVLPEWILFLSSVAIGKALVVLGLLLLWRCGVVPFGQALFFAGGGYGVGLLGHYYGVTDIFVLTVVAAVVGGGLSALAGLLLARYRGIFFTMLSMAFSMILYGVLVKTEALGSTDGIGLKRVTILGWKPEEQFELAMYIYAVLLGMVCAVLMHVYLQSVPGRLSEPIRGNEVRVEYLGISVQRLMHVNLIIAGIFAGLGGAVTAFSVGHIDPEMAYWTTSGGFVFIAILAGTGSVLAPFLGAVIFEVIRTLAFAYVPDYWQIILGGALLLSIFFLPGGLWSLFAMMKGGKKDGYDH